jgi:hypothetical protein
VLGETAAESWERIEGALRAEFGRRPNPASVGPDSETAQQRFSRFLRTDFAPRIRDLGFKGSGNQFRVARGNYSGWFGFQKSYYSTRALVEFTVNWAIRHVPNDEVLWGGRLGDLSPVLNDLWWVLPVGHADLAGLLDDLLSSFRDFGLVAVEATSESGEVLRDTPGPWTRVFDRPHRRKVGPPLVPGEGFPQEPLTPDLAAETASLSGEPSRFAAMHALYELAPDDPRLISILISQLESEPEPGTRAVAARMLGLLGADSGVVASALKDAIAADHKIEVRLSARYALALLNERIREST